MINYTLSTYLTVAFSKIYIHADSLCIMGLSSDDSISNRLAICNDVCSNLRQNVNYLEENYIKCLDVIKEKFTELEYVYKIAYKLHNDGLLQFIVCFNASINGKMQFDHLHKIGAEIKGDFAKINISILVSHDGCKRVNIDKIILFER